MYKLTNTDFMAWDAHYFAGLVSVDIRRRNGPPACSFIHRHFDDLADATAAQNSQRRSVEITLVVFGVHATLETNLSLIRQRLVSFLLYASGHCSVFSYPNLFPGTPAIDVKQANTAVAINTLPMLLYGASLHRFLDRVSSNQVIAHVNIPITKPEIEHSV